MFNLEQSIAEWRKQMLAAGIKAPVPLEELECHLREEVEERIKLGLSEQQAFEATVAQIGRGHELQPEFAKERSWRDLLRGNMSKRAQLILLVWIVTCITDIIDYAFPAATELTWPSLIITSVIIAMALYMVGIFWSIFLFNRTKRVRNVIQNIAVTCNLLLLIPMVFVLHKLYHLHDWLHIVYIPFYFNLFTSILLQSPSPTEPKKAAS
jgi:hypothetical protein